MEKILIIFITIITLSCMNKTKVKFTPVVWNGENYRVDTITNYDQLFYKNIQLVLSFYGYEYEIENDTSILIPKDLANDKDILMNVTIKAQDENWVSEHCIN